MQTKVRTHKLKEPPEHISPMVNFSHNADIDVTYDDAANFNNHLSKMIDTLEAEGKWMANANLKYESEKNNQFLWHMLSIISYPLLLVTVIAAHVWSIASPDTLPPTKTLLSLILMPFNITASCLFGGWLSMRLKYRKQRKEIASAKLSDYLSFTADTNTPVDYKREGF